MKRTTIDIDEKDLKELEIFKDHIAIGRLEKQLLVQSIRKKRIALQKLNEAYGFDKLSEEEIFDAINESKTESGNAKNSDNP